MKRDLLYLVVTAGAWWAQAWWHEGTQGCPPAPATPQAQLHSARCRRQPGPIYRWGSEVRGGAGSQQQCWDLGHGPSEGMGKQGQGALARVQLRANGVFSKGCCFNRPFVERGGGQSNLLTTTR